MILPKTATSRISGVKRVEDHQINLFFRQTRKDGYGRTAPYFYAEEAIAMAEDSRNAWASDLDIDQLYEKILLSMDLTEEAYDRYGLRANRSGTYTAWFRAVAKKYPDKKPADLLNDLANETPCSSQTLTRAARDFAVKQPQFATEAGITALHWFMKRLWL